MTATPQTSEANQTHAAPGRVALYVALLSGALSPQTLQAADEATARATIEEVVVTARKRAERLIDVPESIQVLSADTIERAGISSLNDLSRYTPNVVLNRRQDNEPNVVIRGVGGFGNTQGVGFYVDDVQNFTDQSASIKDIERIEVLKGPQGTLYGGSNIGGAVKLVTKKPDPESFGTELSVEVGEYETHNFFGAVNVPMGDSGRYAARLSAYKNETDSFIDNTFLNSSPNASDEQGVRLAVGLHPTDDLDTTLTLRYNELENGGNVYLRADRVDDYRDRTDLNEPVFNDRKVAGGILQIDYRFGGLSFTSLSSYTNRKNRFLWDLDYGSADAVSATEGNRHDTDVHTQEFRLASNDDENLDWILGAYYALTENRNLVMNADVILGVDAGGPLVLEDFNNAESDEEQYAAFATVNYQLDKLHVGGGLRANRSEYQADLLNLGTSVTVDDTEWLPKVTLAYDLGEGAMVYGNVALGYEPGKVNLTSGTGAPYEPETAINYEIGLKGQTLDRRLSFDLAAFYIAYEDRQFESQVIDEDGVVQEQISNIGESESYGLEGGISFRATDNFSLALSAGYLHAEWKDATFNLVDYDGNEVPASPDFSGNASVDYVQPINDALELAFHADVSHMGEFYWDIPNRAQQESYQLVNLRAALQSPDQKWSVAVRLDNVLDEEYYNEFNFGVFDTPDAAGNCDECHLGAPGTPRTVFASFTYRL